MGSEGVDASSLGGIDMCSSHKCSLSFPQNRIIEESFEDSAHSESDMELFKTYAKTKKKQLHNVEIQNSLRQEILELEQRLQGQVADRRALEKASASTILYDDSIKNTNISQPATKIIKELAILEFEVVHLEQYLLSLYRQAFDQQIPSAKDERVKSPLIHSNIHAPKESNTVREEGLLDSGVLRCYSSLSQCNALPARASPQLDPFENTLRACHSQPLSMTEFAQNTSSNIISLAEHLGTRISDHVPETPNKISEEMIRCMASIYSKISDPPLTNHGLSSPTSSLSSINTFSPKDQMETWSPNMRNSSFDVRLDNPFHIQGFKEFSGPYSTMIEVQCIYRDAQNLGDIEHMLRKFRSLISRLEDVDPRKMKHEEKLAFWINIHNALVMHAFLAYGIPHNSVRRVFLLLKAAYNIGGRIVSADTIQSSILGCRMSRPAQWLRLLLPSKTKFKGGDDRQGYSILHPEPLVHFALSSGSHSDPAVRIYSPKRIMQDLESAKEEYIRAAFGVRKDHRILLPKLIASFAKDSSLCPVGVLELVQQALPESLRKSVKKCQVAKTRKSIIEWIPHNFSFRYLISKELVK